MSVEVIGTGQNRHVAVDNRAIYVRAGAPCGSGAIDADTARTLAAELLEAAEVLEALNG